MNIGICILSYNHPEVTAKSVRSVLARGITQPILIHNGSHSKCISQLKLEFPNIQHEIIEENIGYSGGANRALDLAFLKFEWALFLSNDCELIQMPALPLTPAIVAPVIYKRKIGIIDSIGGGFKPSKGRIVHFRSLEDFRSAKQNGWIPYLPGSSFLLHREIFKKIGGMDTSLGTYWDDVDWSVRAQKSNFQIQSDSNFQVLHRIGKTCHKNSLYSLYYFQRNRKRISWKYCPRHLRAGLVSKLTMDWIRLTAKLVSKKRFSDLKHLRNAIFD